MADDRLWVYSGIEREQVERIARETGVSTLLAKILAGRGIHDRVHIEEFLHPSLDGLPDPFTLEGLDRAACRIIRAVENEEKIVIFGDYDVDGITSTSILLDFLSKLGADVDFYIPDRTDEGYGLSMGAVERVLQMNADLIVTVDCGITAVEEVRHINCSNVDVIITDHHESKDVLPNACAVVNPCVPGCTYPFRDMAGVGVVFKLVTAICIKLNLGSMYLDYLDMVATGTVADVVPITGENRIIVKYGLEKINKTSNAGLKALADISGFRDKPVTTWGISFGIAPRINAAGRMGNAGRAIRLFTTADCNEAAAIASELDEENRARQNIETEIFHQAVNIIESGIDLDKEKVIVAAMDGWHQGIIGIVASKIIEKYYRPSILISVENGLGKGSGRSIEGFDLFKALKYCDGVLEKYGGHELAAGLSLKSEDIPDFRKMINEYAKSALDDRDLIPRIRIDAETDCKDIMPDSVKELEMLAPFGTGNPAPLFAYYNLKVRSVRTVGENRHLKLFLEDRGVLLDAIGFNMGHLACDVEKMSVLDVACTLDINVWNSVEKVQMNLKDIKPADVKSREEKYFYDLDKNIEFENMYDYNEYNEFLHRAKTCKIEDLIPERHDLAAVYRCIRECVKDSPAIHSLFIFADRVSEKYKVRMNYFKAKKSIEILEELNLLTKRPFGEYGMLITFNGERNEKTELENSSIYMRMQALKVQLKSV